MICFSDSSSRGISWLSRGRAQAERSGMVEAVGEKKQARRWSKSNNGSGDVTVELSTNYARCIPRQPGGLYGAENKYQP